jgi:hypothetical protein
LQIYDNYGVDLGSDYDGDFTGEDTPLCDHCDEVSCWTWGFPVILQEDRRWFATMYFNQCDKCHNRAQAIMETSDHLALGKDEWDIIDDATHIITDERWDAFPKWTMERAREIADGKMRHIENAQPRHGSVAPILSLVQDVFDVIRENLAEAEYKTKLEMSARIIQKSWQRLRQRRFEHIELPHPCGICGAILDMMGGTPMFTVHDQRTQIDHPICYQECEIICRSCGCRQCERDTPADISDSPGTCLMCGNVFTCFAK